MINPKLKDLTNKNEIELLKNHIKNNEKSIIIHGPYGIGKTVSVYLLADELNYEVLELNPSNITKEFISLLTKSSELQSLFKKGKIILIDELENIEKRNIPQLLQLISKTEFPVVMTVNDIYNQKISNIKQKSKIIEYKKPSYNEITKILENICIKENINYKKEDLEKISRLSNRDIRAAINDLLISINKKNLEINLDYRDIEQNIFESLKIIFKTKELNTALQAFNNVPLDLDECILWLDENLPLEYNSNDLAKAYDMLSKATLYSARIRRRQHYRFLIYQNTLATAISLAKKEKNNNIIYYKKPSRFLRFYIANKKNHLKNQITKKIAFKTHNSYKKAFKEYPLLKRIITKNNLFNEFNLTEEEIIFLKT